MLFLRAAISKKQSLRNPGLKSTKTIQQSVHIIDNKEQF